VSPFRSGVRFEEAIAREADYFLYAGEVGTSDLRLMEELKACAEGHAHVGHYGIVFAPADPVPALPQIPKGPDKPIVQPEKKAA
jgi:hypothetical protein